MTSLADLERRMQRIEAREEIFELIARYGLVMDDRDMSGMVDLFTDDIVLRSMDGVMNAAGRDAVVEQFRGRFKVLGPSNHFSHDKIIRFDDGNPDAATGIVLSHAEMNRKGQAMLTAIRYQDSYRRERGRWKFSERVLKFFYYVPAAQYLDALGEGLARRNRAYETPVAADWPEQLSTWKSYYGA
jgi:ketosteroid isomerase-like protein